jgi:hypothetical protein
LGARAVDQRWARGGLLSHPNRQIRKFDRPGLLHFTRSLFLQEGDQDDDFMGEREGNVIRSYPDVRRGGETVPVTSGMNWKTW